MVLETSNVSSTFPSVRMVWSIFDGIDHAVILESENVWQHPTHCHHVLLQCTCTEAADYIEFVVKVAIVEIYNERMPAMHCCFGTCVSRFLVNFVAPPFPGIRDLLDPKKDNLKIHEDKVRLRRGWQFSSQLRNATQRRPEVCSSERSLRRT